MSGVEVLEGPGDEPRDPRVVRRRWLLVGALALLLLVGLAVAAVDARRRGSETARVESCGEAARAATQRSDTVLSAMVDYLRPALAAIPESSGRDSFYALLAGEAARVRPGLQRALAECRAVEVWSWHDDLREQRAAYVAHLTAQVGFTGEVAADGRVLYADDPDRADRLAELRERAFGSRE